MDRGRRGRWSRAGLVVAEGMEEPEQAEHLRRLRSLLGQGFLFSRPVSAEQIEPLLEATLRETPDKAFRACADTESRTDSSMEMTT